MANVLKTLHNIVDTLFIGLIPDQTIATQMQAAIGLTWPIFFIFLSFGMGLSVASNGLIGQFVGKKDNENSIKYATNTVYLSIVLGFIFNAFVFFFGPLILKLIGVESDVLEYATIYIRIRSFEIKGEQNENLTQLAKKKDSINLTESLQMIPSEGRIRFVGEGDANFSFTFDFNGTIVTLNGRIHIGPGIGEVDICWNISQGYFDIHANGSFVLSGTYICIEDWLTFRIGTLAGDTGGEEIGLTLMERGAAGDIHLNGLFTIQNISLQISSKKLALSLSLNGTHEADNITISWGENGLHISGSHSGSTVLEMPKFSLHTSLFSISAANMLLMTNSEIQFVEEENRVLCAIHGELYIGLIGVMYGGYTTSVRDITVKGDLNLEMHISSNPVDVNERHITITGSFYVNIDTTFSINGVEVDIKGEFFFETEGGRIDIWVYENSGMVCINATSKSTIEGFYLGVNEKHLQISAGEIYFFAGKGHIEVSPSTLRLAGGMEVRDFTVDSENIHFKTNSMYFGGHIDISSGEEKIVSFSTQAGFSALGLELTIQDYILKADGLSIYAQASGWGEFISTFHAKNLSFNFSGYFAAFNISAGSLDSAPFIGAAYVGVVGDAWVELREGLVEFRVNAGGYLIVGGSPLGPVSIMITGWVHGILDLEKKEMWGEFGANAVIAMPNINLGSTDGSSQIHAALMVTISGEGEFHMTSTYLEAIISGSFSFEAMPTSPSRPHMKESPAVVLMLPTGSFIVTIK